MDIVDSYTLDQGWAANIIKTNGWSNGQKQTSEFRTELIDDTGNTVHTQVGRLSESDCNSFIVGWNVGFRHGFANGKKAKAAAISSMLKGLIDPDLD